MTNEERQKLCDALRRMASHAYQRVPICGEAADEIERLAQSDARLRCLITDNLCGTDTWEKNSSCKCANCQTWLTQPDTEPKNVQESLNADRSGK